MVSNILQAVDLCERRYDDGLVAGVASLVEDGDVDVRPEARQDARRGVPVPVLGRRRVVDQPFTCVFIVLHLCPDCQAQDV